MKKVIERIVESPGAPNENDLWLNGATLKKFQNGEWIPVGGSMGESEEYTIAQALNDLNERIEELEVSGGAKPSHTLTILETSSEDVDLSTALSWLKIDGRTPASIEDLFVFDTNSIIDAEELGYGTFLPSNISKFKEDNYIHFSILFGFTDNNFGKYGRVDISSSGDDNSVFVIER